MDNCKNCKYYDPDWGMWCFNGLSGDGSKGDCMLEPVTVQVRADQTCSHHEPYNSRPVDKYQGEKQ